MLPWLWYILLFLILLAGVYINLLGAPGLWVMVLATVVYGLATHFRYAGERTIVAILVLAGVAELLEFVVTGTAAKRAGATRAGLWGAIIGSVIGGLFFTAIIPVPIIGTVFGVCLGTFVGAIIGELLFGNEVGTSIVIGFGAAIGRLLGIIMKLTFAIAILATVLIAAAPPIHVGGLFRHAAPATLPAAVPSTSRS